MLRSLTSGKLLSNAADVRIDGAGAVCFTGNRETKLMPYRNDRSKLSLTLTVLRLLLQHYIDAAVESGCTTFISGLATGVDTYAAEYVAQLKLNDERIRLIGAMPYVRHAGGRSKRNTQELFAVENAADCIVLTNPNPNIVYNCSGTPEQRALYKVRNYFMVDNSRIVIAACDPNDRRSGSVQTINYARSKGIPVLIITPDDIYRLIDENGESIDMIRAAVSRLVVPISGL